MQAQREWRHHDVADEERRYGKHGKPENVRLLAIRSERCQSQPNEQERYADTRTAQESEYDQKPSRVSSRRSICLAAYTDNQTPPVNRP